MNIVAHTNGDCRAAGACAEFGNGERVSVQIEGELDDGVGSILVIDPLCKRIIRNQRDRAALCLHRSFKRLFKRGVHDRRALDGCDRAGFERIVGRGIHFVAHGNIVAGEHGFKFAVVAYSIAFIRGIEQAVLGDILLGNIRIERPAGDIGIVGILGENIARIIAARNIDDRGAPVRDNGIVGIKRAVLDRDIGAVRCHQSIGVRRERTVRDGQCSGGRIVIIFRPDRFHAAAGSRERAARDFGCTVIHDHLLVSVCQIPAADGQAGIFVVLDGDKTSAERAARNGQRGDFVLRRYEVIIVRSVRRTLIAVCNQRRVAAHGDAVNFGVQPGGDGRAVLNGQIAVIL